MLWKLGLAVAVSTSVAAAMPRRPLEKMAPVPPPPFSGSLSVLTYNIKGVPWPVAFGRRAALEAIGKRLQDMRLRQQAPQIVVLQEAFTPEAQNIGAAAGYRYIVNGPLADTAGPAGMTDRDRGFAAAARWWKGETAGKLVGSGLQILSDYPVVSVRRMAFPAFACAGYDCLANKGALLVSIAIPGVSTPVDILTTHLNSRRASRVKDERSIYAYRRQVNFLTEFVRSAHDLGHPLIAAGDFNVGSVPMRRRALLSDVHSRWTAHSSIRDALGQFRREGRVLTPDAAYALKRARDWQFYASGVNQRIDLTTIEVPFGRGPNSGGLSDHVGYIARFRLPATAA